MDDLFFADMDRIERAQRGISIEPLLKDLSKLMVKTLKPDLLKGPDQGVRIRGMMRPIKKS